jgi:hypothetical protein
MLIRVDCCSLYVRQLGACMGKCQLLLAYLRRRNEGTGDDLACKQGLQMQIWHDIVHIGIMYKGR